MQSRARLRKKLLKVLNKNIHKPSRNMTLVLIGLLSTFSIGIAVGQYSRPILEIANSVMSGKPIVDDIDLSAVQNTYKAIVNNYDGEIEPEKLIEAANQGMVQSLNDEYTNYLNSEQVKLLDDELNGNVGSGIGVELGKRFDKMTVIRVLADHPAIKAGIQTGDAIIRVNGEPTEGWSVEQTALKVRGEANTSVKITVLRSNSELDFNIIRAKIDNKSVDYYIKDEVGVIRITRFDRDTGDLAREAAIEFKNQPLKGVVLDLRNNGGGFVEAAQAVAGIWLDRKLLFTEKVGDKILERINTTGTPVLEGFKTVVIINGSSASASEIIAGAFQDYKIAQIVGEKSFGKGSVQQLIDLDKGSQLKVTIAKWFTPNDVNIDKNGIKPDIEIAYTDQDSNNDNDTQLKAGIDILTKK